MIFRETDGMKKWYIGAILAISVLASAGCGKRESGDTAIDNTTEAYETAASEGKNSNPLEEDKKTEEGSREEEAKTEAVVTDFNGSIHCVEDGELLLEDGERILKLDGRTLAVQGEKENTAPSLTAPEVVTVKDAYLLMGQPPGELNLKVIAYDRDLQMKQMIDVAELTASEREIMSCVFLSEGNRILYNNIYGLYLFDTASGETIDLTQEGIFAHHFGCLEQTGEILMSGADASGQRVLNVIGMDGEKMQKEISGHLFGNIWAFEDFALIDEAEAVGQEGEGVVFRYDAGGEIQVFPLSDSSENINITVSCHGAYYATRTKMQDNGMRYLIRVYSSEDGRMVKELPLTDEEYGDDFRLKGYLICDDSGRIILYGTWKGQETDTWITSERF